MSHASDLPDDPARRGPGCPAPKPDRLAGLAGLVLAGGTSSRMGELKPLLPFGGSTVLERAIGTLTGAGVEEVVVVVGHRAAELAPVVERSGARCVPNPDYEQGMYTSVLAGVRALGPETTGCLVLPADMPAVRSRTVALLARIHRETGAAVVYPAFEGRRGHPPLISARVFPEILGGSGDGGLRRVLERFDPQACAVRVLDEGVALDLDTPSEYAAACLVFGDRSLPSPGECRALLADLGVEERVVRHGAAVAEVAARLAARLTRAGRALDATLLRAAGLLHDLAKGEPDHAGAGARLLAQLGFPRVADLVAAHTDLPPSRLEALDEAALLYLADKLVRGDQVVSLRQRFAGAARKCAGSAEARAAMERRRRDARAVAARVEEVLGKGAVDGLVAELAGAHAPGEAADAG